MEEFTAMVADIPNFRECVLDLHHVGLSPQLIATEIKTSCHCVRNILADYNFSSWRYGSVQFKVMHM